MVDVEEDLDDQCVEDDHQPDRVDQWLLAR